MRNDSFDINHSSSEPRTDCLYSTNWFSPRALILVWRWFIVVLLLAWQFIFNWPHSPSSHQYYLRLYFFTGSMNPFWIFIVFSIIFPLHLDIVHTHNSKRKALSRLLTHFLLDLKGWLNGWLLLSAQNLSEVLCSAELSKSRVRIVKSGGYLKSNCGLESSPLDITFFSFQLGIKWKTQFIQTSHIYRMNE